MKAALSFILVLFFSLQIFSQNPSFVKTNEKDLNIWTTKTGKVLHKLSDSYYSRNNYGKIFNRSTNNGKTWKSDKIVDLIASVRSKFIKKNKNAGSFSQYKYSDDPACLFNKNVIIFINRISLKNSDERTGLHEAIYSEDGINWKYISPFTINHLPIFKLIDDTHFIAINYEWERCIVTINKSDKDLTTDTLKIGIDIPLVEDGKLFWPSGNDLIMSSDFGKTASKFYSDTAEVVIEDVYIKNNLVILTTPYKFIVSKDSGKTFNECSNDDITYQLVCYKDKFYFLSHFDEWKELVLDKNTPETRLCDSTIVPEFGYMCNELLQVEDNVVLRIGKYKQTDGRCENYTYYLLK